MMAGLLLDAHKKFACLLFMIIIFYYLYFARCWLAVARTVMWSCIFYSLQHGTCCYTHERIKGGTSGAGQAIWANVHEYKFRNHIFLLPVFHSTGAVIRRDGCCSFASVLLFFISYVICTMYVQCDVHCCSCTLYREHHE